MIKARFLVLLVFAIVLASLLAGGSNGGSFS
jgi:hypothetical protein